MSLGLTVDLQGNLYLADTGNNRIRRVDATTGTISTIAGNGTAGYSGDGGPALAASLNSPHGIAVDKNGNLFIGDTFNQVVRRVDAATGSISTVATGFILPGSIVFDADNHLLVSSQVGIIRVDPATGEAVVVASPQSYARGVALDASGTIFFADVDVNKIVAVPPSGAPVAFAGRSEGTTGDGRPAPDGILIDPVQVGLDAVGNLYITEIGNHRVRKVDAATGRILTAAGGGQLFTGVPADQASFLGPAGLAVEPSGAFHLSADHGYLASVEAQTSILHVIPQGDGPRLSPEQAEGGPASEADFAAEGVALDKDNNLLLAEPFFHRIRRIDRNTGILTTLAGTGEPGFSGDGGPATSAQLTGPSGVAVDADGNIFIADRGNFRIRRIDALTGVISTFVGNGQEVPYTRGGSPQIPIGRPYSIAFDSEGHLHFTAFSYGYSVRRVDKDTGQVSTVAGSSDPTLFGDGSAATSVFFAGERSGIAFDAEDNLIMVDRAAQRVRVVKGPLPTEPSRAFLVRDFRFEGTLEDELGGSPLISLGATLAGSQYQFQANQGLRLDEAFPNPSEFSIELLFSLDTVERFTKLIDVRSLASSGGVYAWSANLVLILAEQLDVEQILEAAVPTHVVLTRTALNGEVSIYVNGTLRGRGLDSAGGGSMMPASNQIYFFQPEPSLGLIEQASGSVDFIRLYSGVLTPEEVSSLFEGAPPPR